ncbi:DUF6928 family protein [Corynebacterium ciconiae]|uniref:DUF6928 family protein n=1 Tax=Corynebacterium ciconiae TaxID=227319 RepID=UPI001FCAF7DF|nr:hypothetical protein [Corynebacterium ciconiae]
MTFFFVNIDNPADVIATEPRANRGFGRKYLAQLDPRWPITPIGQFSLNRSTGVSEHEFYIAGFPGLSLVQTYIPDIRKISEIDPALRSSLPARDLYVTAYNHERGYGAFAHWQGDTLLRAFAARRDRVYEDEGIPQHFELPFWAGERSDSVGGIALPFEPIDLVTEATKQWVGMYEGGPDVNVVGYATDGRPEPKVESAPPSSRSIADIVSAASSKLGLGAVDRDYDDYALDSTRSEEHSPSHEVSAVVRTGWSWMRKAGSKVRDAASTVSEQLSEKLRHTDRPRSSTPAQLPRPGSNSPTAPRSSQRPPRRETPEQEDSTPDSPLIEDES